VRRLFCLQGEKCGLAGLNVVQISHLDGGRNEAKLTTILRLAKAFGITASELLRPFR
jgi:hypothetical protein